MSSLPPPDNSSVFSEAQTLEFKAAAYWMGIVGRLGSFFGLIACLSIFQGNVLALVGGLIGILLSVWTLRAAAAFRRLGASTGSDSANLVDAMVHLKRVYRLQAILIGLVA